MLPAMSRTPHGFLLASLGVVWAAPFTACATLGSAYSSGESVLEENPDAVVALVAAATLTPVSGF
jgi:hypothetical protein